MSLKYLHVLLTAAILALVLPLSAMANEKLAKELDGKMINFSELKPNTIALMVAMKGKPDKNTARSSDGSTRRPIYVDGILMELPEWVILGQIRAGVFTVVYPGTNIPWDANEDRHPFYPPPWLPPNF